MATDWQHALQRWVDAGLLPESTAAAIAAWERDRQRLAPAGAGLSAPIRILLVLGAVLLGAGVLLLVAAHWDRLAPGWRFGLLIGLVAGLHGLAALAAPRQPSAATALHAVGSIAYGGGVFLAGQLFHLEAHWPAGLLLWGLGAGLGWVLLRQWPQLALLTLLLPAWLVSRWTLSCEAADLPLTACVRVPLAGMLLLALVLLAAPRGTGPAPPARRVLLWVGGVALLPASGLWALHLLVDPPPQTRELLASQRPLLALGWALALGLPLLLAWLLRRRACWRAGLAGGWLLVSLGLTWVQQELVGALLPFVWWLGGGLGLVAWGLEEQRPERVNLGAALAAGTVATFYASEVMSRLDRSLSLIGLGALCVAGGWLLERQRRRWLGRLSAQTGPERARSGGDAPEEAP